MVGFSLWTLGPYRAGFSTAMVSQISRRWLLWSRSANIHALVCFLRLAALLVYSRWRELSTVEKGMNDYRISVVRTLGVAAPLLVALGTVSAHAQSEPLKTGVDGHLTKPGKDPARAGVAGRP